MCLLNQLQADRANECYRVFFSLSAVNGKMSLRRKKTFLKCSTCVVWGKKRNVELVLELNLFWYQMFMFGINRYQISFYGQFALQIVFINYGFACRFSTFFIHIHTQTNSSCWWFLLTFLHRQCSFEQMPRPSATPQLSGHACMLQSFAIQSPLHTHRWPTHLPRFEQLFGLLTMKLTEIFVNFCRFC